MANVDQLEPGDRVIMPSSQKSATFVTKTTHPLFPGLMMVIWRMDEQAISAPDAWFHDALSLYEYVGEVLYQTPGQKIERLRRALLHESQWNRSMELP